MGRRIPRHHSGISVKSSIVKEILYKAVTREAKRKRLVSSTKDDSGNLQPVIGVEKEGPLPVIVSSWNGIRLVSYSVTRNVLLCGSCDIGGAFAEYLWFPHGALLLNF